MWVSLLWLVLAILGGWLINFLLFNIVLTHSRLTEKPFGSALQKRLYPVMRLLLPMFLLLLLAPSLSIPAGVSLLLRRLFGVVFIGLIAWLLVTLVLSGRDVMLSRYDINVKDNLKARSIHTQVDVLVKILVIIIGLVAVASAMMIFEQIRQVGTSILASAGIIGIIVGFAAQRSIATLLAGLQIAITQPIRINDVVIVEGEWGQIEEIALTYVVVRIWDERRLIVPTSNFLEKPFQNWTRMSAELLGTVTFHVDYSLPVDIVRNHLYEILKDNELWDGRVWRLHVINATEKTVELRALVSASNSGNAWELRCDVREKLLSFLQMNYPQCLPKVRAELQDLKS
ncbi:MAG: mechanosensitive ion channel family protein [Desulfuromonadales bacterium]